MDCIENLILLQIAQTLCNQIVEQCQQQQHLVFHFDLNFFCCIESHLQLLDFLAVCLIPRSRSRNQVISIKNSYYIYCYSASSFAGNRMSNQSFFVVVWQVVIVCNPITNKIFYFRVHCWPIYNLSSFV